MKKSILLYLVAALLVACNNDDFKLEKGFELVAMEERAITSVQPMTGLDNPFTTRQVRSSNSIGISVLFAMSCGDW